MSLVARVSKAIERIAPLQLADTTWDNVGLLIEPPYPRPNANQIFLTIDLTPRVLDEAFSYDRLGMIIAYHPPLFKPIKRLCLDDPKQNMAMKCISRGVAVFSPHTAVDSSVGGVNDWIASGLGEGTTKPITPADNPPEGHEGAGMGRLSTLHKPTLLENIIERVKKHFQLSHVRIATVEEGMKQEIKTIGICAGSGSMLLSTPADLFLAGEMSHHDVLAANANGTSVILCEHSNTERGYLSAVLKGKLEEALAQDGGEPIEIIVSKEDRDPLRVV
ncbi:uncharacterized protein VTP21DRAFT_5469 [Calcarisporiella thermophila]|uniref:uncharacterized protein n=1 Tax=Calcarisporiella thermophila TaxID=911321 RepID=UPI0037438F1C